jgi:CRISPR-associated protein Cmr4
MEIMTGLLQLGGQANVGRGWVQGWVVEGKSPVLPAGPNIQAEIASNQKPVLMEA